MKAELLPEPAGFRRTGAHARLHTGCVIAAHMKLTSPFGWLPALRSAWRRARREDADPAGMGTALGLDSITVIDFEPSRTPKDARAAPMPPWQRRLARRSRL